MSRTRLTSVTRIATSMTGRLCRSAARRARLRINEVYDSAYAWAGEAGHGSDRARACGPALAGSVLSFVAAALLLPPSILGARPQGLIEMSERGKSLMAAGKFEEAVPV